MRVVRVEALELLNLRLHSRTCLELICNCQAVKGPDKKKQDICPMVIIFIG
jgi:hypothetical protein